MIPLLIDRVLNEERAKFIDDAFCDMRTGSFYRMTSTNDKYHILLRMALAIFSCEVDDFYIIVEIGLT